MASGLDSKTYMPKALNTWSTWSKGSVWASLSHKLHIVLAALINEEKQQATTKELWVSFSRNGTAGKSDVNYIQLIDIWRSTQLGEKVK